MNRRETVHICGAISQLSASLPSSSSSHFERNQYRGSSKKERTHDIGLSTPPPSVGQGAQDHIGRVCHKRDDDPHQQPIEHGSPHWRQLVVGPLLTLRSSPTRESSSDGTEQTPTLIRTDATAIPLAIPAIVDSVDARRRRRRRERCLDTPPGKRDQEEHEQGERVCVARVEEDGFGCRQGDRVSVLRQQ